MSLAAALPTPSSAALPRIGEPRLVTLISAALAAGALALLAVLGVTGMRLAAEFANFVFLAAASAALAAYCRARGHPWQLSDSAAIVGLVTIALLLCGLVSCVGLRLGLTPTDALLARGDRLVGIDVAKVAQFVAATPALSALLNVAYQSSGPLCAAAVCWGLLAGDRAGMWRTAATVLVAMQITALVSILFPAQGAAVTLGTAALQGYGLPAGAGTYSVAEFAFFHSGDERLVTLAAIDGIVCFPSFHTVMALTIVQGLARSPLRWAAVAWGALTIVSTVPMGGHYAIDLAGGVLVWLGACRLATWACPANSEAGMPAVGGWTARLAAPAA